MDNKKKAPVVLEKASVAAFGAMAGKEIEFDKGINLIKAGNEGGKTTLAAFIRFALYGFDNGRGDLEKSPKKLYTPWSGAAASGALTVNDGRRYRIERTVAGNKESAVCTDTATGAAVYSGEVFGEQILGVGRDVFEKTAFLSGAAPAMGKDTELADRLQNLVFSADEQISGEKAMATLKDRKNALKGRTAGSGRICELERTAATLEERLAAERRVADEVTALEAEAARLAAEIERRVKEEEAADAALEAYEGYEALLLTEEHSRLKAEAARTAAAAEAGAPDLEEIDRLQGLRNEHIREAERLDSAEAEYADLKARRAAPDPEARGRIRRAKSGHKSKRSLGTGFFVLAAVALVLGGVLFALKADSLLLIAAAAAALGLAVAGLLSYRMAGSALKREGFADAGELSAAEESLIAAEAADKEAETRLRQTAAWLDKARVAEAEAKDALWSALSAHGISEGDSGDAINELINRHIRASALKTEARNAATALEVFEGKTDLKRLYAKAEGAVKPEKSREQLAIEKKAASQRVTMYKERLGDVKERLAALHALKADPLATAERLSYTEDALRKAQMSYGAVCMAMEELKAAGDGMKESISPRIAASASEKLSAMTEGAHKELELNTELAVSCDSPYGQKNAAHLSAGAKEGVYLCLRLALLELLYGDRKVPLILDDAFAHVDGDRTARLIKLLADSGHQLIITSCDDREQTALDSYGLPYKLINL